MPIIGSVVGIRAFGGIGFGSSQGGAGSDEIFTTPGSTTWTAPAGVTSVNVVAVGAGGRGGSAPGSITYGYAGGGGGGGLAYKNNIVVTPGQSYTVVVGSGGSGSGDSYFIDTSTVVGYGGSDGESRSLNESGVKAGGTGGTFFGHGGGNGGDGGDSTGGQYHSPGGGGGAGGYTGAGGTGGDTGDINWTTVGGSTGYGGGGGAGGPTGGSYAGGGGGVGLTGPSGYNADDGEGGEYDPNNYPYPPAKGGAGGEDAAAWPAGTGGLYGGGAAGGYHNEGMRNGAHGAVRLVWGVTNPFNHTQTSYTAGEGLNNFTHGQWKNATDSSTSNPQIWMRANNNDFDPTSVAVRNALDLQQVGDIIEILDTSSGNPTPIAGKTFTITGGISKVVSGNYDNWYWDVGTEGLTNSQYFYRFTVYV